MFNVWDGKFLDRDDKFDARRRTTDLHVREKCFYLSLPLHACDQPAIRPNFSIALVICSFCPSRLNVSPSETKVEPDAGFRP